MCGINGIFAYQREQSVDNHLIQVMRDAMPHRGPDGVGIWISPDQRIGFGHRRLSIIDLSESANQPMSNADGTLWVIFNGEIYNHAEIRRELEQLGYHTWQTNHSDTEVILYAFEAWGIDCLHRFRGMFAIALWDAREEALWLIRDRIGVKPLYYSIQNGRIAFASEIKALLRLPDQSAEVNEEALYHYLSFLTTPSPHTLFKGIQKLPGGTWMRISADGDIREHRYWEVWDHTAPLTGVSEDVVAGQVLEELRAAVHYRKVSDVPVGVFLSGGIDSSVNTALFSESESQPVKTFSIGYEGDHSSYQNELHFARLMAETVQAEHHEMLLNVDHLLDFLPYMVQLQDEPIADPVCVPVYYVSKLARDNGVTVAQVGEGADELFLGYPWWIRPLQLQRYDNRLPIPGIFKQAALLAANYRNRSETRTYEYLRRSSENVPLFWGGAEAFFETQKKNLLSPRMRQQFADLTSWEALQPIYQRFEQGAWEKDPLNWMTFVDLNLRLPELLLMRVDKMSMGVSLEARVPFLDHHMVELAMSIPAEMKYRNNTLKYILKKAVRGVIPDVLIDRSKQGFGVPIYDWLYGRLGEKVRQEVNDFCEQTDYFDPAEVNRLLDQGNNTSTWYLLNLAMWWKAYIAA